MFGNKFSKLTALKDKKAQDITKEEVDAVNVELTEAGIIGVEVATEAILDAAVDAKVADKVSAATKEMSDKLTAAQTELKTAQDALAAEQKAHNELKQKRSTTPSGAKSDKDGDDAGEGKKEEVALTETDKKAREMWNKNNPKKD